MLAVDSARSYVKRVSCPGLASPLCTLGCGACSLAAGGLLLLPRVPPHHPHAHTPSSQSRLQYAAGGALAGSQARRLLDMLALVMCRGSLPRAGHTWAPYSCRPGQSLDGDMQEVAERCMAFARRVPCAHAGQLPVLPVSP